MSTIRHLILRYLYARPPVRLRQLRRNLLRLNISGAVTRFSRAIRRQGEGRHA